MPFHIVRNDITKMRVDAIVNTTNPSPGYGSGVDTAVYEAAGEKELLAKRQEIGAVAPGTSFIVEERIRRCLILEEMRNNKAAAKNLGLMNVSKFVSEQLLNREVSGKGR